MKLKVQSENSPDQMKMPDNDISEMNLNGIKILANMKRQDTQ